jgi:hypothetical protein
MVYFSENPIKIDDLGVPPFQETSNMQLWQSPTSWIVFLPQIIVNQEGLRFWALLAWGLAHQSQLGTLRCCKSRVMTPGLPPWPTYKTT